MTGHQPKTILLRDGREYQCRLHQSKRISDALPGASPERKIGEPRQPFQEIAFPALRTKFLWRVIPPRVAMYHTLRHGDDRYFYHEIVDDFVVHIGYVRLTTI